MLCTNLIDPNKQLKSTARLPHKLGTYHAQCPMYGIPNALFGAAQGLIVEFN